MSDQVGQQPAEAQKKFGYIVKWQGGEQRTFTPDSMSVRKEDGATLMRYGRTEVVLFPQLILWVERYEIVPPTPKPKNDVVSDRG